MNKADRKTLDDARARLAQAHQIVEEVAGLIESLAEVEQEKFDNMSEGLQQGERGLAIAAAAQVLGDMHSTLTSAAESIDEAMNAELDS